MLELEALFMLVNILSYTSLTQDFEKMGKPLLKSFFEKVIKF